MANQYAAARGEKASGRGSKILRDRAYTHLKELVDEVRAVGRFLFWNDEARLTGYRSEYARKNRQKNDGITAEDGMDAADDVGNASSVPQDAPSFSRNAPL